MISRACSWLLVACLAGLGGCYEPLNAPDDDDVLDAGPMGFDAAEPESFPDGGGPVDAGPLASQYGLSIATWNLEEFPLHPDTLTRVIEVIQMLNIDLIGIQEITDDAVFLALAEALPGYEMRVSFDSRAFTKVGFLFRTERIRIGEEDVERLFTNDRNGFPRSPLFAPIEVLDDQGQVVWDFSFVVVHLKAQSDEESRLRRASAMVTLEAWMREHRAIEPEIIIVGDFNDKLTDPEHRNVFLPVLQAPNEYTFLTLATELDGERSYIPFSSMIDHILVTNDVLDEYEGGMTDVLELDYELPQYRSEISDHRPVVSYFGMPRLVQQ